MPFRLKLLVAFRIAAGVLLLALAELGWTAFHWDTSLNVAIAVMGAFILIETSVSYVWARPTLAAMLSAQAAALQAPPPPAAGQVPPVPPAPATAQGPPANPFADAAKVAISTQGLVLGLVSFSDASSGNTTVKIGTASLVAGVLLAIMLYMLVAGQPPPDARRGTAASFLLAVVLWALGFGLLCVVAGSWSATPNSGGGTQ